MPLSKESRKSKIIELLSEHETLTITSIAKFLEVSEMTVRRYLKELEDDEIVLGTNNGYMLMDNITTELPFFKKQLVKVDEKKEIAIKALSFIKPNDHIFLDAGTTTFELAKLLKDVNFPLTIATNDIKSSSILVDSHHTVILTGGIIQNNVGSMYGVHTIRYLEESKFDISFVATEAIFDGSIYAPTREKAFIKKLMIDSGYTSYLLVDDSKFDRYSYSKIASLDKFDGIVVNSELDDVTKNYIQQFTKVI